MRSGCFFIGSKLRFDPIKKLREDRTAAERNNVAYATRCRRRILLVQRFVNNYTTHVPVQSDSQAREWYSYFENDVLDMKRKISLQK